MKNNILLVWFTALLFSCLFFACSDDDVVGYTIDLNGAPDRYETLNVSDKLEIPIKITCEAGLKSAFYKLATQDEEGNIKIGSAVDIPVSGNTLDTTIVIPVSKGLCDVVFAVYDNDGKINTRTIHIDSVKDIPSISFRDDVEERNTACIGIPFVIRGSVMSEHELTSLWAVTMINGSEKDSIPVTLANKQEADFEVSIPVEANLSTVLIKASNVYGGVASKTFKVLNVVDKDFVEVSLENGATELNRIIKDENNTVNGSVTSGSDIVSVKYAIKKNGVLGNTQDAELIENLGNESKFSLKVSGEAGLESVIVTALNKSNVSTSMEYMVPALRTRIAYLKDVEMSTDPADGKCFLALYEASPVFGTNVAIQKQNRIDFYLANKGSGVQPLSPHAYGAGAAYYNASLPFLKGFTDLTYAYLSSRRGKLYQEEFDEIVTDNELTELLEYRIIGPNPDGENYNIRSASRRVGDTFNDTSKKDGGFILGWGNHTHPTVSPAVVKNESFALFWVKSVTKKSNGHWVMIFDVKYPVDDQRINNNEGSIAPYDPYPL